MFARTANAGDQIELIFSAARLEAGECRAGFAVGFCFPLKITAKMINPSDWFL